MKTLIAYSSVDGHAKCITETVMNFFCKAGYQCDAIDLHQCEPLNLIVYEGVFIVAAIRYGRFNRCVKQFIKTHQASFAHQLTAFLGVCLIARKPEKQLPKDNIYLKRFLRQTQWQPDICEGIAGALRYPRYGWFDRQMIRLIMRMTGGETNPSKEIVYTDWAQVERLTQAFFAKLKQRRHKGVALFRYFFV